MAQIGCKLLTALFYKHAIVSLLHYFPEKICLQIRLCNQYYVAFYDMKPIVGIYAPNNFLRRLYLSSKAIPLFILWACLIILKYLYFLKSKFMHVCHFI